MSHDLLVQMAYCPLMSRIELCYKIYKINDFSLTKSGAADFTTCFSLCYVNNNTCSQSGAADFTILTQFFAILSQLFSLFLGNKITSTKRCCRYALFISEVRRVNVDCTKRKLTLSQGSLSINSNTQNDA